MDTIKVVDARMGRGKSTAAIHYMNAHKDERRFMYVTPFLTEVARFRNMCKLEEPTDEDAHTKLSELRELIYQGKSVCTTHSLYQRMTDDMLDLIREKKYMLILDEAVHGVDKVDITLHDRKILSSLTTVDENGNVVWNDPEYTGKLDDYKMMADHHTLYMVDDTLINTFNSDLFTAFDDVIVMTYLFVGSVLEAYMKCFNIPYEIWCIEECNGVMMFKDGIDKPPAVDYRELIHIIDRPAMNSVGDKSYSLSKNWYMRRGYFDPDVVKLRNNMQNYFKNMTRSKKNNRYWTCFKDHRDKLIPPDGSYASSFLQLNARATNEYAGCVNLAYMINRYEDPNLLKFLGNYGHKIDPDMCALSDLLQWIWRSAIRNGRPIDLYIPSKRMRNLLLKWMDTVAEGGAVYDHME